MSQNTPLKKRFMKVENPLLRTSQGQSTAFDK